MFTLTLLSCLAMGQVPPSPGPVPPVPVVSPPRVLVITITVDASGAVRVDQGGGQVTPTPPGPDTSGIAAAARSYVGGIPKAFRQVAASVRSGQVATAADVVDAVGKARQQAGLPLAQALQATLQATSDESGAIKDGESVAAVLEAAAAAMEGH